MKRRRVLVTRPEPGCSRTARRVADLGLEAVKLPVTEAIHDPAPIRRALGGRWSALAVTSGHAVSVLESVPEALAAWRGVPLFAVGARTAALARQAGFTNVVEGGGTGRALAGGIVATASAGGATVSNAAEPLLYLAGKTRSDAFERALALAGIPFSVAECYEMRPLAHPAAALAGVLGEPFAAAIFYSRETAVSFFRLLAAQGLTDRFRAGRIVCLSDAVAGALPAGLGPAAVTPGRPTEEAVLEMLAAMRE